MRLPRFDCFDPRTVEEACAMLDTHSHAARICAGGTDLLVRLKQRLDAPRALVNLSAVRDLRDIQFDAEIGLRIGALTTLREIADSALVRAHYPMLAQAARAVASPQVRNQATLGGNLCLEKRCWFFNQSQSWRQARAACLRAGGEQCWAIPSADACHALVLADTAPALIALRAQVVIASSDSTRVLPLDQLYAGLGNATTSLAPNEILTQVRVPPPLPDSHGVYLRYSTRPAIDFALVQVAALLIREEPAGICREARLIIGALGSLPVEARQAASLLNGQTFTHDVVAAAADTAVKEVKIIPHIFLAPAAKRRLARAFIEEALRQANEPKVPN